MVTRVFENDEEFYSAAERRGIDADKPKRKKKKAVASVLPTPAPEPQQHQVSVDATAFTDAVQQVAMESHRMNQAHLSLAQGRDEKFADALEKILTAASVQQARPMKWKITVTERDYEGRITSLDVEAEDLTH